MQSTKQRAITRPSRVFFLIWGGQVVSLTGTALTDFALGVWVYQRTGSATQFALISFSAILPAIVLLPVAGAIVDRWDRRLAMIVGDGGAALGTLVMWLLLLAGRLEVWHICLLNAFSSACSAFQGPAYTSVTTLLVPPKHLGRANGMIQLGEAAAEITAPMLAGALIMAIGLHGIILIDLLTFLFAVFALLIVKVPQPEPTAAGREGKGSFVHEVAYGWAYIRARPGLLGLLFFFAVSNLTTNMIMVLIYPLILSFSTAMVMGTIASIAGSGMLLGALAMSAWGGPRRRVHGVLGFSTLCGIMVCVCGLRPNAILIGAAAFVFLFSAQFVTGCSQALWQNKVEPDVQGRVFATRWAIVSSTAPLARLLAGPLTDNLFEPWLAIGGPLASSVGQIIGSGPGRGVGFLFIVLGSLRVLASLGAFSYPRVRFVEKELPDAIGSATCKVESSHMV